MRRRTTTLQPSQSGIAIGELSRRTGVNIETIRYYEKIKLLPSPPRTMSGRRVCGQDEARKLAFIKRGRELGFALDEIRALLRLVERGYSCGEVRQLTRQHIADVHQKITDLRRIERTLRTTSEKCAGGKVPECPIIDVLFGAP
jgi:MerR family transcriptional regulator, mercuric resistance operon regulatory protein